MTIRLLSAKLINRIAAGEVIERPASVVKELVENAIDAGATDIKLMLEQGGRNLIKIIDNGCGMAKEQIKLSLQRHATSKLSTDDLLDIKYMGFRGEALPSIASISRMLISSKVESIENGWSIKIEGGEIIQDLTPSAAPNGTMIAIRDLFFSTPNRLKFLKTEKAESQHIIDLFNRIAMVYPEIKFSLTLEGKLLYEYNSRTDYLQRLIDIKGKAFAENSIEIFFEREGIKVRGYAGIPTYNRANSNYLHLFVNKRAVRDSLLIAAVRAAYQDFIPYGRYPIVVIFLEIPYQQVDVNVHPTKAEVRFQDKNLVRNTIISALKIAIKQAMYKATSEKNVADYCTIPYEKNNSHLSDHRAKFFYSPPHSNDPRQNVINTENAILQETTPSIGIEKKSKLADAMQCISPISEEKPLGEACLQLYKTYIVSVTADGVIITDQHAAHERLVYEHLKSSRKVERQHLIMPEMVECNGAEVELLMDYAHELEKLGLVIEKMGDQAIIVREVPSIIGSADVKKLMQDILDTLNAFGKALSLEKKLEDIYGTFACHTSIRAGRALNINEMNALLRQMESTTHSGQCNHGRPTYIQLKKIDIEKLFERR